MTIENIRTPDLAQISSYSRLIQDISDEALAVLQDAEPTLEALAHAAADVHALAARGETGDVLGLVLAVGRAEEALAPLRRLGECAHAGLNELREALHLPSAPSAANPA
jgi:hypothetical protein